jgi:hypothetical protein
MMSRKPPKPVLLAIVGLEVVSAAIAWRDLAQRPDCQVRGKKNLWRAAMLANPGNSLAYWALGRR